MKKIWLAALLLAAGCVLFAQSPSVKLLKPNGNEDWQLGSQQQISWLAMNLPAGATVRLELRFATLYGQTFPLVGTIATGLTAQNGTYSWTVGQSDHGTASPGCGYKMTILVENQGNPLSDSSDSWFRISRTGQPPPTISFPSIHGGECLALDFRHKIEWHARYTGPLSGGKLILLNSQGAEMGEIAEYATSEGYFNWGVGHLINKPAIQNNGSYRIKAVLQECGKSYNYVSPIINLVKEKKRIVTSPQGGENWDINAMKTISWRMFPHVSGPIVNVYAHLTLTQNGYRIGTIANHLPADGVFDWAVGHYEGGIVPPGSGYAIHVEWCDVVYAVCGISAVSAKFSITSSRPRPTF